MDTTYTAATATWIHMATSWILHTKQHGYTFIHHGYYIHCSSSMDTHGYIMDTTYTGAAAWIHMDTSWILHTQQQQQHGYTWIHHGCYINKSNSMDKRGYIMDTTYIHSSNSMNTHGYIMDTIYTASALIHMDTSWIPHTQQQQQHGYTWIHHGYYIHNSSSMDTYGYIMDSTYTAAAT
jgi:arginyl-tRNA--protein-N-Asp/Glu arginylyltransferase